MAGLTRGTGATLLAALAPPDATYQAARWRLEQPELGVLVWRTPTGRTYTTTPTQ
jgi:hypothetical protein